MSASDCTLPVDPDECLPAQLRAAAPVITPVGAGLSGAKTYYVEGGGRKYVLKIAVRNDDPAWAARAAIQRAAAEVGVAPGVVHVDESRRAILSEHILDRTLGAYYGSPATRDEAIVALGALSKRVHALPIPGGVAKADPLGLLHRLQQSLGDFPVPGFVRDAVRQVQEQVVPKVEGGPVLSHNDMNPSNVAFDGRRIYLLDWDTAAPHDRYFDLATISVFLRMNQAECLGLLSAYGESWPTLPVGFIYDQRLVGVLCGSAFLNLARMNGHPGASGSETREGATSLGEFYQQLRSGLTRIDSPAGQWSFGLALVASAF